MGSVLLLLLVLTAPLCLNGIRLPLNRSLDVRPFLQDSRAIDLKTFRYKGYKYYYCDLNSIGVGTPKQNMRFAFHMIHFFTVLPSVNCTPVSVCSKFNGYDPNKSKTSRHVHFYINMMSALGGIKGNVSLDDVTFKDKLKIRNVLFFTGTEYADNYANTPFDGEIGLLRNSSLLDKVGKVSLDLGKTESQVIFGGDDPSHYLGELSYFPIWDRSHDKLLFVGWLFNVSSISMNGNEIGRDCNMHVDIGIEKTVLPIYLMEAVAKSIGAEKRGGEYKVPCNKIDSLPPLVLNDDQYNHKKFTMHPKDYMMQSDDESGYCSLGFTDIYPTLEHLKPERFNVELNKCHLILADQFTHAFYLVLDYATKRVGIASRTK